MENINPRSEKLHNPDIVDLKKLISERIIFIEERLKECLDDLHANDEMLRNFQRMLQNLKEYNSDAEKINKEFPKEGEHTPYSKSDIHEIVDAISDIEKELLQINSYVSTYAEFKAVFQAQLDQIQEAEDEFRNNVTSIDPEQLQ